MKAESLQAKETVFIKVVLIEEKNYVGQVISSCWRQQKY